MARSVFAIRRAPTTSPNGASLPEFILRSDQPCLCRSGKALDQCCFDLASGWFRYRMPNLRPPGPPTGFSHSKCYLRGTADCSTKISGEHVVSESLLLALGEGLELSGAHWLEPGETLKTSSGSFGSNILCKRHNEALSPLDDLAGRLFREMDEALIDLDNHTGSPKPVFHLFNGEMVERWMLKVTCGLYHSFGSKNRQLVKGQLPFDMAKAARALLGGVWEDGAGLYLRGTTGTTVNVNRRVSVAPLSAQGRIIGAAIGLHDLWFDLVFDAEGASQLAWSGLSRRPSEIVIREGGRTHSFLMTWPPGTKSTVLNLNRVEQS